METVDPKASSLSMTTNGGSLKAKMTDIEAMIKTLNDEMIADRKTAQIYKNERDTLKQTLGLKSRDVKDVLCDELKGLENLVRQHFAHQKAENERVHQQVTSLRNDRNSLKTQLVTLQRRINQLEREIGSD